MKKILLSFILLGGVHCSFAGGFQLNLQGIQQLAMGGSGTAFPWDASTVFYNPGGLSSLQGMQLSASLIGVKPSIKYVQTPTGGSSYETIPQWFTPFNLYVGGPLKKGSKFGLGFGIYTPFGSGTKWPDEWEGRYLSQEIELQSIFFQPTISYRLNDILSVGAGFVYAYGNVTLRQALPVQFLDGSDGNAKLRGHGSGLGLNVGIHAQVLKDLNLGLTYRSQVNMKVKSGDAVFHVPTSLESAFPNSKFSTSLPLPAVLSLGVAYTVNSKLIIQADFNYVNWKPYDTLSFDYKQNTPQLQDTHTPRLYENTLAIRLGAHYQFSEKFAGMIGGAYDPTPVQDNFVSPELPDANRMTGSLGLSYKIISKLKAAAAIELVTTGKRDATFLPGNFSGKYQSKAFNIGLGLSYTL